MIFVDSNVLIDLIEPHGRWRAWSGRALASAAKADLLIANAIVVGEIARQFDTLAAEHAFLSTLRIDLAPLTDEAAFLAGRAHAAYRARGGAREGILADFLIGGHAKALDATLLTRDRQRFAAYFPELKLITPETDNG